MRVPVLTLLLGVKRWLGKYPPVGEFVEARAKGEGAELWECASESPGIWSEGG